MTQPTGTAWDCPDCHQTHPRGCHGHVKLYDANGNRTGQRPCRLSPIRGHHVCNKHGGGSAQTKAKAARNLEEQRIVHVIATTLAEAYGDNVPPIDPAVAMLDAVSWKYAEVLALRTKVAELDDDDRVWGRTRTKDGGDDAGTTYEAAANAWWVQLQKAEDALVRFAKACRDARVDEARVLLAQRHGTQVAQVIKAILDALDLTPEQLELVPIVVPAQLRMLTQNGA